MAEILFVLVTVYVVYVVHSVICKDRKTNLETLAEKAKALVNIVTEKTAQKMESKPKPKPIVKPVVKKVATVKEKAKPKAKAKVAEKSKEAGTVKHPETGEVTKIASSYRMTKRWIKDALVTEGLLDKVYKTNEIDAAAKVKIAKALDKLSKMKKYQ